MAASYNLNQQANQPQGQVDHPLQAGYGNSPQDPIASVQHPLPPVEDHPPQGYPSQAQADLPPAYTTHEPVSPPGYNSKADQLAYNFRPQPATSTVVVAARAPTSVPVATQPATSATTTLVPPLEEDHVRMAACAVVFSFCTLITCGAFVICLFLSVPAVVLSSEALDTRGNSQRNKAGISIGLNVAVVVCTVVLLVVVVTPVAVTAGAR